MHLAVPPPPDGVYVQRGLLKRVTPLEMISITSTYTMIYAVKTLSPRHCHVCARRRRDGRCRETRLRALRPSCTSSGVNRTLPTLAPGLPKSHIVIHTYIADAIPSYNARLPRRTRWPGNTHIHRYTTCMRILYSTCTDRRLDRIRNSVSLLLSRAIVIRDARRTYAYTYS